MNLINKSNNTDRLETLGIKVYIGQKSINVKNAKIIVISTAISETNEEYIAAKKMFLPIVHRSEMKDKLFSLLSMLSTF